MREKELLTALSESTDLLFIGDLSVVIENEKMRDFCDLYGLTSLSNKPICQKDPENPSYIDLILTNCPRMFQNLTVIGPGFCFFHKNEFPKA